jgi:hypothetical protein
MMPARPNPEKSEKSTAYDASAAKSRRALEK